MKKRIISVLLAVLLLAALLPSMALAGDAELVTASNLNVSIQESYYDSKGGYMVVGGMANGPSSVCNVFMAGWQETAWTESQIAQSASVMTSIWKDELPFPQNTPAFQFGQGFPVDDDEFGKTVYVLFLGIDANIDMVGYCIVRVTIPSKTETGTGTG